MKKNQIISGHWCEWLETYVIEIVLNILQSSFKIIFQDFHMREVYGFIKKTKISACIHDWQFSECHKYWSKQILFFNAYGSDPYLAFLIQYFFYFFPLKFLPVFLLIAFILPTFSLFPRVARIIEIPSLLLLLYSVLPPQIYQKSASGFHPGPRIALHSLVLQIKYPVVSNIASVFPPVCHV